MKMCSFSTYHEKYTIERIRSDVTHDVTNQEKSYKKADGNNSSVNWINCIAVHWVYF